MAQGPSRAVGVLTQNIASAFYGEILRGIEMGFRGTPLGPLFATGATPEEARRALAILLSHHVEGVIVLGGQLPDHELLEVARDKPLVAIGRSIKGLEQRCLHIENTHGAYEATKHLLSLGHRSILHLGGPPGHPDAVERQRGYERALTEAQIPLDRDLIIPAGFDNAAGRRAIKTMLGKGAAFTAIFAANDEMAFGACLAVHRHGLSVPRDVSVVGFDDQPLAASFVPPLTTVRQPTADMGVAAAKAVLGAVEGRDIELPRLLTELVLRESTAAPSER
jgi:LacI family transcriptional regulator